MHSVNVIDKDDNVLAKHAWQNGDSVMFRQVDTKRLVEYKWSDIEKGEYNNGKFVYDGDEKVADLCFETNHRTIVLMESGSVKWSKRENQLCLDMKLNEGLATTWHSLIKVNGIELTNVLVTGMKTGGEEKCSNVLVLVSKTGKQIATATIEMESNDGMIQSS